MLVILIRTIVLIQVVIIRIQVVEVVGMEDFQEKEVVLDGVVIVDILMVLLILLRQGMHLPKRLLTVRVAVLQKELQRVKVKLSETLIQ